MNRKIILSVSLMILVGFVGFVIAQESRVAFPLSKGWNLVSGFTSIENIYGADIQGSNIKAIYAYIAPAQQYVRMYPKPEVDKLRFLHQPITLTMILLPLVHFGYILIGGEF